VSFGLFRPAVRTAAGGERFGEFAELDLGLVELGQLGSEVVQLGRRFAEEVEE
jgi:hypothetical protein